MTPKCLQLLVAGMLFLQMFSCKPCPQELTDADKKILTTQRLLDKYYGPPVPGDDSLGYEVDAKHAELCFKAYDSVMRLHNFADTPLQSISKTIPDPKWITHYEVFRNDVLDSFLVHSIADYQSQGVDKISIRIKFGFYTAEYIGKIANTLGRPGGNEAEIRKANQKRINRIGVFIVTGLRKGNNFFDGGSRVLDFGALQP